MPFRWFCLRRRGLKEALQRCIILDAQECDGQGLLKVKSSLLIMKLYAWGVTTHMTCPVRLRSHCEVTFHRTLFFPTPPTLKCKNTRPPPSPAHSWFLTSMLCFQQAGVYLAWRRDKDRGFWPSNTLLRMWLDKGNDSRRNLKTKI